MIGIDTLTLSKDENYLEEGTAYIALKNICSIAEAEDYEGVWLVSLVDGEVFGVSEETRAKILMVIKQLNK